MNASAPTKDAPAYQATLGLQRAPFLDQIDDRFFYADPVLVQRLDLLQHLTQFGDMLLGVIGPTGSGKSTLLQQFKARGGANWHSCRINAGQIATFDELLAKLCACFAPDVAADPERAKAALLRQFQTLRLASQLPVVLIDDAQLLPNPVLHSLLELGGNPRDTLKLVRVVLFAEPGLEQKLIQAGLHSPQQPLLHALEIPRFDIQQAAAYLMYRLAVAGYSGDSPFSLTEIRALHKAAEGQPGKLNVLAHETLMEHAGRLAARKKPAAAETAATSGKPRLRRGLAVTAGVALLLAAGGYLFQSGLLRLPASGEAEPVLIPLPEMPPESAQADDPGIDATPATGVTTESASTPAEEPATAEAMPETADAAMEAATATSDEPPPAMGPETTADAAATEPASNTLAEAPPAEATAAASSETAVATAAPEAATAPAQAATPAPEAPAASTAPSDVAPAASAAPPAPSIDATPAVAPPAEPAPTPAPPPAAAPPRPARTAAATATTALREDWLRERPATHYTLQLLGVRSEESLRSYLAEHNPPAPVAYFRTDYKGGDWFVLVQGDYPSMAAARDAVATLPAAIRKAKPWPRSFASVHADLDKTTPVSPAP